MSSRLPGKGPTPWKKQPYGGYYQNRTPDHDRFLTETGPGTPMGEYMRRFWHPVCMSEELTDVPRYIRILGEELVAFRDRSGQVGVLALHCTHRGASLEYGLIQKHGIMCCYHGIVWDVDGSCLDIPFPEGQEHEGERIRGRAWQPAYKAFERDGLVFAYMGPPEEEPPFPEWDVDWGLHPGDEMVPYSNFYPCNWLQVQDNAADQYHHIPLHSTAVVPGHEQGTTFGEAGAAPYEVRPDLQFFRVHEGRAMAWTSSRRVDDEKIFIRVNYQFLPNGSFHSYLFEDGSRRNHFSRTHMFRWVVPVDDENCIMFGWRMFGPYCDPRGVGKRHLVGFEKMDFLEGQCGMRRPERLQYGQGELPPIPNHHRERTAYRDAQHAPGDYEAVTSSRRIAVHSLEHLLPFDGGVSMFRQLLRLVIDGKSPRATPEAWRDWLSNGPPNSYCSGNVLVVPRAPAVAEEVERRREVAKRVIEATTESDAMHGDVRKRFMQKRLAEIEAAYAPEPTEA